MSLPLVIHLLSAIIWIGGMFFAIMVLRPAAAELAMEPRVLLWARIFDRFVPWIWACVLLLPLTGYEMIASGLGGFSGIGVYLWLMQLIGWVMISLFLFVFIKFYRKMRLMVRALLIPEAGLCLERIRQVVTINLILGLLGCMVGAGGRYW